MFDVGLLSFSLQLLPSDSICLLHLDLHLPEEERGRKEQEGTREITVLNKMAFFVVWDKNNASIRETS